MRVIRKYDYILGYLFIIQKPIKIFGYTLYWKNVSGHKPFRRYQSLDSALDAIKNNNGKHPEDKARETNVVYQEED